MDEKLTLSVNSAQRKFRLKLFNRVFVFFIVSFFLGLLVSHVIVGGNIERHISRAVISGQEMRKKAKNKNISLKTLEQTILGFIIIYDSSSKDGKLDKYKDAIRNEK